MYWSGAMKCKWLFTVVMMWLLFASQLQMCLLVTDMLEYMPVGSGEMRNSPGQAHKLRLCFTSTTGLCLAVYLAVPKRSQFCVLQLVANENSRYSLDHISTLFSTQVQLGTEDARYVKMRLLMMDMSALNRRHWWILSWQRLMFGVFG